MQLPAVMSSENFDCEDFLFATTDGQVNSATLRLLPLPLGSALLSLSVLPPSRCSLSWPFRRMAASELTTSCAQIVTAGSELLQQLELDDRRGTVVVQVTHPPLLTVTIGQRCDHSGRENEEESGRATWWRHKRWRPLAAHSCRAACPQGFDGAVVCTATHPSDCFALASTSTGKLYKIDLAGSILGARHCLSLRFRRHYIKD